MSGVEPFLKFPSKSSVIPEMTLPAALTDEATVESMCRSELPTNFASGADTVRIFSCDRLPGRYVRNIRIVEVAKHPTGSVYKKIIVV